MDKREIYEHLAKIYLDASAKKKKKPRRDSNSFKILALAGGIFTLTLAVVFLQSFSKKSAFNSEISLVLVSDVAKINFHFNPAKKEFYSLELNKLNLSPYKTLGFSVRKSNYTDTISLRVEFINVFKERSEIYVRDIPYKWQDYKLDLASFKGINDWSEMSDLKFAVEEWNAKEKKGVVYLDNVRLIK